VTFGLCLALFAFVFAAACSKSANSTNTTTAANQATPNASPGTTAMTPTAVVKAFSEASDKKDLESLKKYLSSNSLPYLEAKVKAKGRTLEEDLKATPNMNTASWALSNEQISGDTATVDMKTPAGQSMTLYLVKEGGQWKVDIEKTDKNFKPTMPPPQPNTPGEDNKGEDDDETNSNTDGEHGDH